MYDLNKKIIFTHPPKCGGTSIEDLLGFLQLREKYPNINVFKHGSLEMHVSKIKTKGFNQNDFLKFSIIRNPWSRAVSYYNHNKYKEYDYYINEATHLPIPKYVQDARQMSFKEFVFTYYKGGFNTAVATKPFMFLRDKFSLDFVIRLEHLKADLALIQNNLQLNLDLEIPHLNNSCKYIVKKNYREYYDEETKDFIESLFKWDIEYFMYKFEE